MKIIVTFGIAIVVVASAVHNSNDPKPKQTSFDYAAEVIDIGLQEQFEQDAISAVQQAVKRVTDQVVASNVSKLSEFADQRRKERNELKYSLSNKCDDESIVCSASLEEPILNCSNYDFQEIYFTSDEKPIDTIVGFVLVSEDDVPYLESNCGDKILLGFTYLCPLPNEDKMVMLVGYFEWMCPADRRFSTMFTVTDFMDYQDDLKNKSAGAFVYAD